MRNLLAFFAAAVLTFAGVGYYLDWYQVRSDNGPTGHKSVNIDLNSPKIIQDVHKGVEKSEQKLDNILEKKAAQGPTTAAVARP
jgi:hypothetical protein